MAETILVTGATGTVGSEVVKQLVSARAQRKGEDIIVKAAARSANDDTFRNLGAQVVQHDYNKPDSLSAALRCS